MWWMCYIGIDTRAAFGGRYVGAGLTWRSAFGEPPGSLMASHFDSPESNALSERSESKGSIHSHAPWLLWQAISICPNPLQLQTAHRSFKATRRCHRRLVWFVYILRCSDDSFYIGETDDVAARLSRHNNGRASLFTASRRPARLVFVEAHDSREDALARERQLKRWTRAKKEAPILGDRAELKRA